MPSTLFDDQTVPPASWPPPPPPPPSFAPPADFGPPLPPLAPPDEPGRSRRRPNRVAALGIAAGLILGAGGTGVALYDRGSSVVGPAALTVPASSGATPGTVDVKAVLAKVQPAIVSISETVSSRRGTGSAAGSGMIIGAGGLILTNAHVITGGTNIQVTIPGRGALPATVLGSDPAADVALLQVSGVSGLPTVTLASTAPAVGDPVVAVGNALALGVSPTVTTGIVSALDREIDVEGTTLSHLIQTDAAINPGSSGGALLDAAGTVIGMTSAGATSAQSIGFAIASTTITPMLAQLQRGSASSAVSTPSASAGYLGITSRDSVGGVQVVEVVTGAPAAAAGLVPGDVIVTVDGQQVASSQALTTAIGAHKPGDAVTLTLQRGARTATVKVTLGTRP
jgi:putative serine protease PepD